MLFLKILDDREEEYEIEREDYRSPIPEELRWRAWAADPEGITGDELTDFVTTTLFPTLKELPADPARDPLGVIVRRVDELMVLCDQLAAKHRDLTAQADQLLTTAFGTAC